MRRRLFTSGLASAILTAGFIAVGEASNMTEGLFGRLSGRGASSKTASAKNFEVAMSDEEWRRRLSPEQYRVLRQHGTERAGTSPLEIGRASCRERV